MQMQFIHRKGQLSDAHLSVQLCLHFLHCLNVVDKKSEFDNNKIDLLHIQKFALYRKILQPQLINLRSLINYVFSNCKNLKKKFTRKYAKTTICQKLSKVCIVFFSEVSFLGFRTHSNDTSGHFQTTLEQF